MPLTRLLNVQEALELDRWRRIEIARRAAKVRNIPLWGKMLFPARFNLPFCYPLINYFISIMYEDLTGTEAPRYHAKTTDSCFLIPIFTALEEPEMYRHYLQVQATDAKANSANRSIKYEFEENEELHQLYGDQIGKRWTDEQFVLKSGVCFSAVGAGQSIRGINYLNARPDNIRPDDLYDEKDIHNPESTQKKNEWFWSTLYPARAQGRRTSIQVTGTASNELDLMRKLKTLPHWKCKTFQALPEWDGNPLHPVAPLWPEKNSFASLMRDMESMTTTIFMREMQNEPRDDASSIIKAAWIHEYDPDTLGPGGTFEYYGCVLGCDPSIGQKEENDYTGMALIYVYRYTDGGGFHYYIDQLWNEHLTMDKRIKLLQDIQDRQPDDRKITTAYIEGIAGFKDFVAEAKRRTTLPIREVDKKPDKLAELESKGWFFESGRVWLNKNIDMKLKENWKYQMCTNHPKFDDMRDATLLPLELHKPEAFSYMD